jgi:hypothetical protein
MNPSWSRQNSGGKHAAGPVTITGPIAPPSGEDWD